MPPPCDSFTKPSDLQHVTSEVKAWVDFNQAGLLLFLIRVVVTGSLKENTFFLLGTLAPPVKSSISI